MKKMTCKQMGGPCDFEMIAETADEMVQLGSKHVEEMKDKDEAHKAAADMMAEANAKPELAQAWYTKFQADFNALPPM